MKEEGEFKVKQELAKMNKLFDEEKQELYTEIKLMKERHKETEKDRLNDEVSRFFEKWFFIAKLLKVKSKK